MSKSNKTNLQFNKKSGGNVYASDANINNNLKSLTSYPMLGLLQRICNIEQPSSLSNSYIYSFNKVKRYRIYKLINNIFQILTYFLGNFYTLISKPVFLFTQKKLVIFINYYIFRASKKLTRRHVWKYNKIPARSATKLTEELKKLTEILSKLLNLRVELQLNRLKYPYHDSTILSKLIAFNTKKRRFTPLISKILKKASIITKSFKNSGLKNHFNTAVSGYRKLLIHKSIPTILTGLKVQISGRLTTQRVVPKRTVKKREKGGFKRLNNNIVDYAIFTSKNKRGSYSVKVWSTSKVL